MNVIEQGDYTVRRLDLIPNSDPPTSVDYFLEVLTPSGQKLQRADNVLDSFKYDKTGKKTNDPGNTRIITYQAYKSSDPSVDFTHIEEDSDTFKEFPLMVIAIINPPTGPGGETSIVSGEAL